MTASPRSAEHLWEHLRNIFGLSAPYRGWFATAVVLSTLGSLASLAVPLGLRELLNAVFAEHNRSLLDLLALALFGLFVLQGALNFAGSYLLKWTGERVVADLRKRVYGHLQRMSVRYFADERMGEISSRLTNDVAAIRRAITDAFVKLLTAGLRLVGSVALMVYLNWRLSLLILVVLPAAALAARYFGARVRTLSRNAQDKLADATAVAEEALSTIEAVKAFARTEYERARYGEAVETLFETARRKALVTVVFSTVNTFLFFAVLVAIFWYGGVEVIAGRLTAGDLVAFLFYARTLAYSTNRLAQLYTTFNSAAGASSRLFELLDTEPEIEDRPDAPALDPVNGAVAFDSVSFGYTDDDPVLRNVSLAAQPGDTVALVGPSGAGKTTLLHLIPRFFDPDDGAVRIDDTDIRSVRVQSLRRHIAVVSQRIHLFANTVYENIRYGRLDASPDAVKTAAQAACAHGFIQDFPNGYETQVGEGGVKLSGGQRQRIAIARAFLKNAQILLLDEATSSLDSNAEAQVQKALTRLMDDHTTFAIAHRLASIKQADRILVLRHGRITERGTHDELVDSNGFYREMAEQQFDDVATVEAPSA